MDDELRRKIADSINQHLDRVIRGTFYIDATSDPQPQTTPSDLVEHLRKIDADMRARDPRKYGAETVYIFNQHTYSLIMEHLTPAMRYEVRSQVMIGGESHILKVGEVIEAHEDMMPALTGGNPRWVQYIAAKKAGHQLARGEITYGEWWQIVSDDEQAAERDES